jgi:hypothetical protein
MSTELLDEVEAINSIYGEGTLVPSEDVYILKVPSQSTSFRLQFPENYPDAPLSVLGTQNSGAHKGDASRLLDAFRETVGRVYNPGEVCLFDVIEDLTNTFKAEDEAPGDGVESAPEEIEVVEEAHSDLGPEPPWVLSEPFTEKKSVFVARVASVTSPDQAKQYLYHLVSTDKKVAKASHNITAWRIRGPNDISYQDCDDDGETAAGGRVLHLMQLMDVWDVMVVITRWYGGIHLGPDRFRLINSAARDGLVRGGFVVEQPAVGKKKGKK